MACGKVNSRAGSEKTRCAIILVFLIFSKKQRVLKKERISRQSKGVKDEGVYKGRVCLV